MYGWTLQACAVFEKHQCVVAPPYPVAYRGNIACFVSQFIRSSKCCIMPRTELDDSYLTFLGPAFAGCSQSGFTKCVLFGMRRLHWPVSDSDLRLLTLGYFK
jgi:hypothetical protein